jgi:membrane associated rhomboid family serine protease
MEREIRPGRWQVLPTIIKNLIIINALVWLAQITVGKSALPMTDLFALHYVKSDLYKPWQFLTYMFMHDADGPFHILFNMLALWMFGSTLENLWGAKRFLIFYLLCGLFAGFVQMLAMGYDLSGLTDYLRTGQINEQEYHYLMDVPVLGASGAVMGIFAAFAYSFPNNQLFIFPIPFPIKAKWALLGFVAYDLFGGIRSGQGGGVAHFAHIGGALMGIILVFLWNRKNRRHFY